MNRIKIVTKSTYRDCLEYLYIAVIQMIMWNFAAGYTEVYSNHSGSKHLSM
ncbi:hypothetical protein GCWU000325_02726 [Alloprevotella tannerae ATCC 51259]|uniref:Uncharacterized protein n=1 Tax=Alloprevotella tannerae ATCC 51259 TaxID=626522 RepID=C9LKG0_9BACT|nr:hypothetical protein GCWU000325_02726 [Alloprevotella tannerae ATCC 51259]